MSVVCPSAARSVPRSASWLTSDSQDNEDAQPPSALWARCSTGILFYWCICSPDGASGFNLSLVPGELWTDWTAALVSRGFCAAARLAGLCLSYRLIWHLDESATRQLDSFLELVSHTLRHDSLVSLSWTCCLSQSMLGDSEVRMSQETEDQITAVIALVVALVPYLVRLSVELPSPYGREIDQLLLVPASRLLAFELRQSVHGSRLLANPGMLFSGSAPVLHDVSLHSLVLPNEGIPAFAAVRKLRIANIELFPPTNLARCFPSLRSLHLDFAIRSAGLSLEGARCALEGLQLYELTVGGWLQRQMSVIDDALPLRGIPLVRQHGCVYDLGESLWLTQPRPLSVRAREATAMTDGPMEVLVVPRNDAWRRVFLLGSWDDIERGPLCVWPPFPAHMAYLRLDGQFLPDFLRTRRTYATLQRIHIDLRRPGKSILPPRGPHGDPRVECPSLDEVAIYALDKPRKLDSRDVVRLGNALGQLDRAVDPRARLVLVGVSFAMAFARSPLNSTFLTVDRRPFATPGSAADEMGLWDFLSQSAMQGAVARLVCLYYVTTCSVCTESSAHPAPGRPFM